MTMRWIRIFLVGAVVLLMVGTVSVVLQWPHLIPVSVDPQDMRVTVTFRDDTVHQRRYAADSPVALAVTQLISSPDQEWRQSRMDYAPTIVITAQTYRLNILARLMILHLQRPEGGETQAITRITSEQFAEVLRMLQIADPTRLPPRPATTQSTESP